MPEQPEIYILLQEKDNCSICEGETETRGVYYTEEDAKTDLMNKLTEGTMPWARYALEDGNNFLVEMWRGNEPQSAIYYDGKNNEWHEYASWRTNKTNFA